MDEITLEQESKRLWNELEKHIQYFDEESKNVIELAFTQMVLSHNEDKRQSGEFYIIHPVAAAITLAQMQMDLPTISATLLHDVPEDTQTTLKDLSKDFSAETIFLIESVTKLSKVRYEGEERYAENLRKMFVAISQDLRVVFIKLADRLHNLSTLHHLGTQEKRYRIAKESLEIYAPIAERLGIGSLQSEIEDQAFKYVYEDQYKQFIIDSNVEINRRNIILARVLEKAKKTIDAAGIKDYKIYGRSKKYYSLYKKMLEKDMNLKKIFDLVALRIVVKDIEDAYFVMSSLQQEFNILIERTKDYISKPKANGYQSLHMTAYDEETQSPFEFQIRTNDMHEFAEYGIAAHFAYKGKSRKQSVSKFTSSENLKWIKDLVELGSLELTAEDYLSKLKLNIFDDRIFVLTPKNHSIDLPRGSTPLDFAFRIHEDIGSRTILAKINNKVARFSDILQNGDVVEVLTDKRQRPSASWLDWVKTKSAKGHIKSYLKNRAENNTNH
jgi:GTP diphosphokinase / guanosine-3',5'-bis(diphosphate) 3'-diphosphatase